MRRTARCHGEKQSSKLECSIQIEGDLRVYIDSIVDCKGSLVKTNFNITIVLNNKHIRL